jgi:ParB family chromosome partitioning protein
MTSYEKGNLYQVSIVDLRPDPDQPRKVIDPEALAELKESIRTYGILQPLLFRVGEQGWLIIVSGERRYLAAKALGLLLIPGICVEGSHAEIALVENLQRQDLTCIEEAEALQKLMDEASYNQEQLAAVIGKPRTSINETMSLMKLPQSIRDECRGDRTVGKTMLISISRRKQERAMLTEWTKYKEDLLQKQEAAANPKVKIPLPASVSFCQFLDKSRERVQKTAAADWSEEELTAARESIDLLKEALENFPSQSAGVDLA